MRVKRFTLAAIGVAVLASCSVQPATNVAPTSATLNGRLVNPLDDTLRYHYEWAPTIADYDGDTYRTPFSPAIPGTVGRSADFILGPKADWVNVSTAARGLEPGTEYHYRICGTFVAAQKSDCLPGKTFTTPLTPSSGDQVRVVVNTDNGFEAVNLSPFIVAASSGADGANVKGTVTYAPLIRFEGTPVVQPLTCMKVTGRKAVIRFGRFTAFLADGGSTAEDTFGFALTDERDPGDCSDVKATDRLIPQTIGEGRVIVSDR